MRCAVQTEMDIMGSYCHIIILDFRNVFYILSEAKDLVVLQ